MNIKNILISQLTMVFILFAYSTNLYADDIDDNYIVGEKYFQNCDFKQAKTRLLASAQQGSVLAKARILYIDECIESNDGHIPDSILLELENMVGNVYAENLLGDFYQKGCGVTKNLKKAINHFERSANNNNAYALGSIGAIYREEHNYKNALEYSEKAANLGHNGGYFALGNMYQYGLGVDKDINKAYEYYKKAAENNFVPALYTLSNLILNSDKLDKYKKDVIPMLQEASDKELPQAQFLLGFCYATGKLTSKDEKKAFDLFLRSASKNYTPALNWLTMYYEDGIATEKDNRKAFYFANKSAELNDTVGLKNLGRYYLDGIGINKDIEKSIKYLEMASKNNDKESQFLLGLIYNIGVDGTKKDNNKAFDLMLKSAEQNFHPAQKIIGDFYLNGIGVEYNLEKAIKYYELASKQGNKDAEKQLSEISNNLYYTKLNSEGFDLWKNKDYNNAFKKFDESCNKGNISRSCIWLGIMYRNGQGVKKDSDKAWEIFKDQVNKGNEDGILQQAYMLEYDFGFNDENLQNAKKRYEILLESKDKNVVQIAKDGLYRSNVMPIIRDFFKYIHLHKNDKIDYKSLQDTLNNIDISMMSRELANNFIQIKNSLLTMYKASQGGFVDNFFKGFIATAKMFELDFSDAAQLTKDFMNANDADSLGKKAFYEFINQLNKENFSSTWFDNLMNNYN